MSCWVWVVYLVIASGIMVVFLSRDVGDILSRHIRGLMKVYIG